MKSRESKYLMTTCLATALMLLLQGCASNDDIADDPYARGEAIRCPAGYTMICEAKKVGRIRFGTMGKENLESCACEPEYTGRPARPVIPSVN
jgi:hypothetical protein